MKVTLKGFGKEEGAVTSSDYKIARHKLGWKINKQSLNTVVDRDDTTIAKLYKYYLSDETVWAMVQAISLICLGERFVFENIPESSKEYKSLDDFFLKMWPKLYLIVQNTLIFGNSFAKIIRNRANELYDLEVLYPLDVTKTVTLEGVKKKIVYTYNKRTIKQEEMLEIVFFSRSDSIYGIPMLASSISALERKMGMESNINTAIERHMPRFHIKTLKDAMGRYPDEDERQAIGKEFETLAADEEFVSTDLIDINVVDTKSTIPQIQDYMTFSLNSVLMGSLMPPEILGLVTQSGSFATAKSRSNVFLSFLIPFYQRSLESQIDTQLLKDSKARFKIMPPEALALAYSK